ncbi:hypothetical protein RND71_005771 [Anisodus tanguticus]|uniref:Uncharacterized protein n=1 Tax=Anisodus tanguticus TaxID=243964 RepID=A0AAE1SSK8_9SOLA|nr:hypothetical protein RND71_005771 [Anisodus tanguticus]
MSMLTKALLIPLNKIPTSLDQLCLRVIRGNQINHNMQIIFKICFKNDLLVTQIPCQHKATVDDLEFSHNLGCTIQILKERRHPLAFILTKKIVRGNLLTKIFIYCRSSTSFSQAKTYS